MARLLALAALAALLLPALAGCTEAPPAAGTAMAARATADAAARAWSGQAELAAAITIEGDILESPGSLRDFGWSRDVDWSRTHGDRHVGDGIGELWAYLYTKPGGDAFRAVVDGEGDLVSSGPLGQATAQALGTWRINSDDATRRAIAADEQLRASIEGMHWGITVALNRPPEFGRAIWTIAASGGNSTGGGARSVVIDAVSGDAVRA